jgi:hypothetical protein
MPDGAKAALTLGVSSFILGGIVVWLGFLLVGGLDCATSQFNPSSQSTVAEGCLNYPTVFPGVAANIAPWVWGTSTAVVAAVLEKLGGFDRLFQ